MPSAVETTRMRNELKKVYTSAQWAKRVNLMLPDQVTAIYLRLKKEGKIK